MLYTYDVIVVGRREIGDNSCFIDILTDEQGIIEAKQGEIHCGHGSCG